MTQRRRRKLNTTNQDRPPFEPLTPEDAHLISSKGELGCADDGNFYYALEELRLRYLGEPLNSTT
jgi:hypothetical protein